MSSSTGHRKKVDSRVRTLIENAMKTRTRSFFVVVGDRGKDQVVNLHHILSKAAVKARPSVLWCYNKELSFSTHRQKRMREIKKLQARGIYDHDKEDPFDLFISSTTIRWAYYRETHKILGQTFGMCVLQDFEAITPNLLCRTIETVEGGGIVVLLLHTMSSLKQLYALTMDVHARFRTEAHGDVVGRFNERFILSLSAAQNCLVLDDELNVLPISKHARSIVPRGVGDHGDGVAELSALAASSAAAGDLPPAAVAAEATQADRELVELKSALAGTELVGALAACCRTLDQAKALLTFAEAISEKTLRSTVALTAGRGRGKSAALGLAIAAALGFGYANIFVTSPSPENLKTLFEFVFKGLEALAFKEHVDYEAIASTNPEFNGAVVRVNVFRGHRQTVQYIEPHDVGKLSQAELLVVDEAAAIPLPAVKALLGPYLVFLASTVNGYEGTGRSLSLKLIQQLRQQASAAAGGGGGGPRGAAAMTTGALPGAAGGGSARTFREVTLAEPIRYAAGDPIERWLNDLLCLDATTPYRLGGRLPAPSECELYAVDRDALFSYHRLSEAFLHRVVSLFVASHYKNSPNDLQLLSDAPAHRLFVLLGPQQAPPAAASDAAPEAGLPDVLAVIQVCLEGRISRDSMRAALARGGRASGDLIPWTLSQQFQDDGFAGLSGARIVRIATHPDATRLGYGTRALALLTAFYEGKLVTFGGGGPGGGDDEEEEEVDVETGAGRPAAGGGDGGDASLTTERVRPRKQLPPLLLAASDIRRPEPLDWLGTSYGLTLQLFNFWRRGGLAPVYLRQTANDLTAEHTIIMVRPLDAGAAGAERPERGWAAGFVADFARRYMQLLSFEFRSFDPTLALSVMDAACSFALTDAGAAPPTGAAAAFATAARGDDDDAGAAPVGAASSPLSPSELGVLFTPHDLKRLEGYARNLVDYHMVLDLLPDAARMYFAGRLLAPGSLPRLQAAILLSLGLQRLPIEAVAEHFNVPVNTALALFNKAVRKLSAGLRAVVERAAEAELDAARRPASGVVPPARARGGAGGAGGEGAPRARVAVAPAAAAAQPAAAAAVAADPVLPAAAAAALLADPELRRYAVPSDAAAWDEALSGAVGAGLLAGSADGAPRTLSVRKSVGADAAAAAAAGAAAAATRSEGGDHRKRRGRDREEALAPSEVYDPRGRLDAKKGGGGGGKKSRPER